MQSPGPSRKFTVNPARLGRVIAATALLAALGAVPAQAAITTATNDAAGATQIATAIKSASANVTCRELRRHRRHGQRDGQQPVRRVLPDERRDLGDPHLGRRAVRRRSQQLAGQRPARATPTSAATATAT